MSSKTMPPTAQSSIVPTDTSPTSIGNLTWTNFPLIVNTCAPLTLYWNYSSPPYQEIFVYLRLSPWPQIFPTVTLAKDIDVTAVTHWTWPNANATAGEYVVEAYYGPESTAVASPRFVIVNGTDTSCLASNSTIVSALSSTSQYLRVSVAQPSGDLKGNTSIITLIAAGGAFLICTVLAITVRAYHVRSRRRKQPRPRSSNRGSTGATHADLPSSYLTSTTWSLRSSRLAGSRVPSGTLTSYSPLVPNRRPPSPAFYQPNPHTIPPVDPYSSHEQIAGSIIEASTIESRMSVTSSDVPSMAELMGTFSSYPPSYVTYPSLPPSYATNETQITTATPPRSAHMSAVHPL